MEACLLEMRKYSSGLIDEIDEMSLEEIYQNSLAIILASENIHIPTRKEVGPTFYQKLDINRLIADCKRFTIGYEERDHEYEIFQRRGKRSVEDSLGSINATMEKTLSSLRGEMERQQG